MIWIPDKTSIQMMPNMLRKKDSLLVYLRFLGRAKMVHFRGDLWAMRWSVTPLKWVYAASRRFIVSIGVGLGSKSALLLEILASENSLFSNEKPP
jgi:hypothetical protein